jgi:hypothetical protein
MENWSPGRQKKYKVISMNAMAAEKPFRNSRVLPIFWENGKTLIPE